jgi:serine/threonine protein kinase
MPPSLHTSVNPRAAVAVLIGVGDYRHREQIAALRYPPRDARALARALTDPELCAFPAERVQVLTDKRARRAEVVYRLAHWLPEQARGAELALIYFAGHGVVERAGEREEGYLLPWDTDPDQIATHGVAMSDLARWIDSLSVRAVVVCLDCCHAGQIIQRSSIAERTSPGSERERDLALRPSVLAGITGRGRFLIASCDQGQKSLEVEELKHGLFTYHLLRGLRGAGDRDGDGKVGVGELFSYVSTAVTREAREKYQREQTPWTSAIWKEEVILSVPRAGRRPEPSLVLTEQPEGQAELIEWLRSARRRRDPEMLPLVFRSLGHKIEAVRQRAQRTLRAFGWEAVTEGVKSLARTGDGEKLGWVLDGLEALEAHHDTVELLDRLEMLLHGDLHHRTARLLAHKRLGLDRERVAAIFRDTHSPYQIEKVLGPGTYTAAYLARTELTGHEVVVRVLLGDYVTRPAVRARFLELTRQVVPLVHHNLVLTREARALPEQNLYYTVRDYVAGATLREVLASGRRFDALQSVLLLRQVLEGLTPLHRIGLAHGGVKPGNIFIARDDRVILGDPSLPLPEGGWDTTRLAYDLRYAPPEMFLPGSPLTPLSDLYSLGCVAHELFRGAPPFVSDNPYELISAHQRDAIPSAADGTLAERVVAGWLLRLLAREANRRFANLAEAANGLRQVEQALLAPATPPFPEPEQPHFEQFAPPKLPPITPEATLAVQREEILDSLRKAGPGGPAEPSVHLLPEDSLASLQGGRSLVGFTLSPVDGSMGEDLPASIPPPAGKPASGPLPAIPNYEILRELGRGGMGVVYLARQVQLERLVALKMILSGWSAGQDALTRFQREAEAIARLQHPNIVQVFDAGEHEGKPYLALEFCGGGNLADKLGGSPLPAREAALLVTTLAQATHAAHQAQMVHRDLKPSNVLLTPDGTPKITDFGLAKRLDDTDAYLTQSGLIVGTPSYMAPEQATGKSKNVGPACDIYSLGAILYECLTGRPPFKGATVLDTLHQVMVDEPIPPRQLVPRIPRDLEVIVLKCLEKEPARRYSSTEQLAQDLQRWLEGTPIRARPVGGLERLWKWARRRFFR